jgi:hypothetical protein
MTIDFSLEPKPPFRLDLTAWALRRRPSNAVDWWDGETYRRVLMLNGKPCEVAVTQIAAPNSPRLQVAITGARLTSDVKIATTSSLERLLGVRVDLTAFYRLAARDANLGPLAERFRGLKPLSRAFLAGQFSSETLSNLGNEAAVERLRELRGVGRWTAEYVLLRGLRRLDVYPGDDVGACNNLQRWLKLEKPLDYESVRRVLVKWQPYAGFIYFHLLLDRLTDAGHLAPGPSSKSGKKVSFG